jgi:hypothetical protein
MRGGWPDGRRDQIGGVAKLEQGEGAFLWTDGQIGWVATAGGVARAEGWPDKRGEQMGGGYESGGPMGSGGL